MIYEEPVFWIIVIFPTICGLLLLLSSILKGQQFNCIPTPVPVEQTRTSQTILPLPKGDQKTTEKSNFPDPEISVPTHLQGIVQGDYVERPGNRSIFWESKHYSNPELPYSQADWKIKVRNFLRRRNLIYFDTYVGDSRARLDRPLTFDWLPLNKNLSTPDEEFSTPDEWAKKVKLDLEIAGEFYPVLLKSKGFLRAPDGTVDCQRQPLIRHLTKPFTSFPVDDQNNQIQRCGIRKGPSLTLAELLLCGEIYRDLLSYGRGQAHKDLCAEIEEQLGKTGESDYLRP